MSYLKYFWFILVSKLMFPLPDWQPVMRLRGTLVTPCFKSVGKNFQLASTAMVIGTHNIEIGDDVYIAHNTWVQGRGGLTIGNGVMLAPQVIVVTTQHTKVNGSYRFGPSLINPVTIGDGTWVGAGAQILPGTQIGKGCLCAAGAIVNKSFSDNNLIAGVPAKAIGKS